MVIGIVAGTGTAAGITMVTDGAVTAGDEAGGVAGTVTAGDVTDGDMLRTAAAAVHNLLLCFTRSAAISVTLKLMLSILWLHS
jgi:hypothetical protein